MSRTADLYINAVWELVISSFTVHPSPTTTFVRVEISMNFFLTSNAMVDPKQFRSLEIRFSHISIQMSKSRHFFAAWIFSQNVWGGALFVFSIGGSKQNVKSFWTPVSESVCAFSHGNLGFALHGSFFNHFLIGWFSSTANKNLWNKRLIRLP